MSRIKKEVAHSPMFETIKKYYDDGKWNKAMVRNAVTNPNNAPFITTDEYKEIVGEDY